VHWRTHAMYGTMTYHLLIFQDGQSYPRETHVKR